MYSEKNNTPFYAQYGQTEAAGRMAYLPPEDLLKKGSSIGFPIKNGEFEINKETQELIYYGENVLADTQMRKMIYVRFRKAII